MLIYKQSVSVRRMSNVRWHATWRVRTVVSKEGGYDLGGLSRVLADHPFKPSTSGLLAHADLSLYRANCHRYSPVWTYTGVRWAARIGLIGLIWTRIAVHKVGVGQPSS